MSTGWLPKVSMLSPSSLFFAIVPPADVRDAIEHATNALGITAIHGGYRVSPVKYHITILHLGEVDTPEIESAARQAGTMVAMAPFTFSLGLAHCFPNKKVPWWIGPQEDSKPLSELHDQLRTAAQAEGISLASGRFVPHVTVIRESSVGQARLLPQVIELPVSDFVLLRSHHSGRDTYEEVERWHLRETGAHLAASSALA